MTLSPRPIVVLAFALTFLPLRAWAGDLQGALAYVPSDSIAVVGADVDRLRTSPLFGPLLDAVLKESHATQELKDLEAGTGFSLQRDVHAMVAAFPPVFVQDDDEFLIVVEAQLDEARVIAFAKKQGADLQRRTSPHGAYWAIDGGDGAMAFRGRYVVLGGRQTFRRALAAARGGSARSQGPLAGRLGAVSSHDAFVVGQFPPAVRRKIQGALPSGGELSGLAASLDVRSGLQLRAKASTDSPGTAQQLANLAQAGLDELRQDPQAQQTGVASYLASITVRALGADLEASLVLTQAQVQSLVRLVGRL